MKGKHVRVRRSVEITMHAVKQRMCGLVRDDVVRQTCKDCSSWVVPTWIDFRGGKIAEQQRLFGWAVIGVCLAEGMRVDAELLDIKAIVFPEHSRRPHRLPAKRSFEICNRAHRNCINHLLVEL